MTVVAPVTPAQRPTPDAPAAPGRAKPGLTPLWTLYTLSLRQHLHGKRWMVVCPLLLLPAGLALLVRGMAHDVPLVGLEFMFAFMFIPQALLPLLALIYASGLIQDEQEDQTLTYLLVRPIPKWAVYGAKLAATLTTTVLLSTLFTVLTYLVIYGGAHASALGTPGIRSAGPALRCFHACWIHALAVTAYCSLFGLLGLATKRALITGIVYIAVIEGLLANLPFGIRFITVIYHTRLIAYRMLPFLIPTPYRTENISAEAWQLNIAQDPRLLEHPAMATSLAVLLLGSLACALLAAWLCWRREFYVKTPEKA